MQSKHILHLALLCGAILLIPIIGNMYFEGWHWTLFDFVFAGVFLFGAGMAYLFVASKGTMLSYRIGAALAVIGCLLLVWINGAVGIIGNEGNAINLLYFAIPAVGLLGATFSGLQARGMSFTLIAMAVLQMLVPTFAFLVVRLPFDPGVAQVFALNAGFAFLFGLAALLFWNAQGIKTKLQSA